MKSILIVALKGKASQVLKLFDLYCKERGAVTLGEMATQGRE